MRYYYLTILFVLCTIFPFSAYGMEIGPVGYRLTSDPNSAELLQFTLTNTSDSEQTYAFSVQDGLSTDVDSSITTWFRVPGSMTLRAQETVSVEVELFVPPTAVPGDRYAYILFTERDTSTAPTKVQSEAGIPVTITVAGDIYERIEMSDVTLKKEGSTILGQVEVKNTGNIEVPISGNMLLRSGSDTLLSTPVQSKLRSQEATLLTQETEVSEWYVGPVFLQVGLHYGILGSQVTETKRLFVVGKNMYISSFTGLGVVGISLLGLRHRKKKYVTDD